MTPEIISDEVISHKQQNTFSRIFRRNKSEKQLKSTSNSTIRRLHLLWKKKVRNGNDEEIKWLLSENSCSTSSIHLKEKQDEIIQTKIENKRKKKLLKRAGKLLVQTCRYISLGITGPGIPSPHIIANYPAISYTKEIYPFDYAFESEYYDYSTYNGYTTAPYSPSLFF